MLTPKLSDRRFAGSPFVQARPAALAIRLDHSNLRDCPLTPHAHLPLKYVVRCASTRSGADALDKRDPLGPTSANR